jgi:hypothetical protein
MQHLRSRGIDNQIGHGGSNTRKTATDLIDQAAADSTRSSTSGSNIQPWNTYVLTGAPLAELKTCAVERVAHGDPWDERQYEMYPPALKSPYGERRSAFGKERYSAHHPMAIAHRYGHRC